MKKHENVKKRILIRTPEYREIENLKKIPDTQIQALGELAKIFNAKCEYPWYVIGSIAFIINTNHTKKQPKDIDIIFHEKDYKKVWEELSKKSFLSSTTKNTNCKLITGKIKIKNEYIDAEVFAQSTEKPNGIINPGAKETIEEVIKIKPSHSSKHDFLIISKRTQIELYFKSLFLELKEFDIKKVIKKTEKKDLEIKSKKFINRIINLIELSNNNHEELFFNLEERAKRKEEKEFLEEFKKITKEYLKRKNVLKSENVQQEIEQIKKIIGEEIRLIIQEQNKYCNKKVNEQEKNNIKKTIKQTKKTLNDIKKLYGKHEELKKHQDLAIYIFIRLFEERFTKPHIKKLKQMLL